MDDSGIDIRSLRELLGENQTDFALRFGVDQSTIARWEARGIPRRGAARASIEWLAADLKRKRAIQKERV